MQESASERDRAAPKQWTSQTLDVGTLRKGSDVAVDAFRALGHVVGFDVRHKFGCESSSSVLRRAFEQAKPPPIVPCRDVWDFVNRHGFCIKHHCQYLLPPCDVSNVVFSLKGCSHLNKKLRFAADRATCVLRRCQPRLRCLGYSVET